MKNTSFLDKSDKIYAEKSKCTLEKSICTLKKSKFKFDKKYFYARIIFFPKSNRITGVWIKIDYQLLYL